MLVELEKGKTMFHIVLQVVDNFSFKMLTFFFSPLGSQEKEKSALISAQSKLKSSQKKVENLSWEVEVLQQKYARAIRERDEIHSKFSSAIIEMQQKSSLKYMILEKKISAMREELNVKEAQLHASGITGRTDNFNHVQNTR